MKKIIMMILFLSISFTLFAQNRRILTPDGKLHSFNEVKRVKVSNGFNPKTRNYNSPSGTIDTLHYDGPWDTSLGIFGQDWILQWFVAPADLNLLKVGFACFDNLDNMSLEVKVVKLNWSSDELLNAAILQRGYYEALGNGYNDITAFLDNPDRTGDWTSIQGGEPEPFGKDIISDGGMGIQILPIPTADPYIYQWISFDLFQPEIMQGEIFGIAIKNLGPNMDQNRIGFWAHQNNPPTPAWKFYANGHLEPGLDFGWWTRELTLNFAAVVDLLGDGCLLFFSYTPLNTTLSTEPRTVTTSIFKPRLVTTSIFGDNPVTFQPLDVKLYFSTDNGANWSFNPMVSIGGDDYEGEIPGFPGGTEVEYYISATDTADPICSNRVFNSTPSSYLIFAPSGAPTLVIYNGLGSVTGFPQDFYWGFDVWQGNTWFDHDRWAYGELPLSVANNYKNIIEFCNSGPNDYNDAVIREWLAADGTHNYYLTGQEWLGARYGFRDSTFTAGTFEFDILGINHSYNDVSFDGTSGQNIPSLLMPVAGTQFGGPLSDLFNSLDPPADSMKYNPGFEVGMSNWIDAFDVEDDVEVDMYVETRGIAAVPDVVVLPTMAHRTLPAGNKIVFVAYDPIALNTAENSDFPYYYWVGGDQANSPYQALQWFGIPVGVALEENEIIPGKFRLSQNYPNPFNPSTKIKFTIPTSPLNPSTYQGEGNRERFITLKVYDVLGNEIATLVNEEKPAGIYEVEFNSHSGFVRNLTSGVYFYQLKAGSFVQTKKMIYLK